MLACFGSDLSGESIDILLYNSIKDPFPGSIELCFPDRSVRSLLLLAWRLPFFEVLAAVPPLVVLEIWSGCAPYGGVGEDPEEVVPV